MNREVAGGCRDRDFTVLQPVEQSTDGLHLYDLTVDRMLLNSKNQPKADGLPVPTVVRSAGLMQLGNFATGHVSSIVCSATDRSGKKYDLRFESDGSPITVRRVIPTEPTIRQRG